MCLFFAQRTCFYIQHAHLLRENQRGNEITKEPFVSIKVHQLIQLLNPACRSECFVLTIAFNFYEIIANIYQWGRFHRKIHIFAFSFKKSGSVNTVSQNLHVLQCFLQIQKAAYCKYLLFSESLCLGGGQEGKLTL